MPTSTVADKFVGLNMASVVEINDNPVGSDIDDTTSPTSRKR
jgi:hypothetical protein